MSAGYGSTAIRRALPRRFYDTPSAIASLSTDNTQSTHATHVAGIMGGAYNKGCDMVKSYNGQPMVVSANNTYYGLARGAEYAVGVGTLYDANIMDAAQKCWVMPSRRVVRLCST